MMIKKIILGTLGYIITSFIVAVTWHFALFPDVYARIGAYSRQEPIFALGILSMLIQGIILSYLFQFYHRGIRPIKEGIIFALIMGTFMVSLTAIAFAAKVEVSPLGTWFGVQIGFHLIQFILTGVILGVVFGKK